VAVTTPLRRAGHGPATDRPPPRREATASATAGALARRRAGPGSGPPPPAVLPRPARPRCQGGHLEKRRHAGPCHLRFCPLYCPCLPDDIV